MAANYNKEELSKLKKDDFSMVEKDKRIFDKKFDTKPVGYFRDAMIRFARNKTNVIASLILFTMIALSIIVPIVTTKNYTRVDDNLRNLSPRWPFFENFGIMTGRRTYTEVRVDRSSIDPDTGLGMPYTTAPDYFVEIINARFFRVQDRQQSIRNFPTFRHEFIDMDTLKNESVPCTGFGTRDTACYGGEVIFRFAGDHQLITLYSEGSWTLDPEDNPNIVINVPELAGIRNISVLISLDGGQTYEKIQTLYDHRTADVTPDEHMVDVFSILEGVTDPIDTHIKMEISSRTGAIPAGFEIKVVDAQENDVSVPFDVISAQYNVTFQTFEITHPDGSTYYVRAEFASNRNSYIDIDLQELTPNTSVVVMVENAYGRFQPIHTITEAGHHQIPVFDSLNRTGTFNSGIRLAMLSDSPDMEMTLGHVSVYHQGEDDPHYHEYGWHLAQYVRVTGETTGTKSRINAERLMASFVYDAYAAAFGERGPRTMGSRTYYNLLAEYDDRCEIVEHPYGNEDGWGFISPDPERMCMFSRVEGRTSSVIVGGVETYSYRVFVNYGVELGYDSPPYFIFGTDNQGRDLFALTWLGLRTSLILGVVASFINITVGIVYGSISGYYGGKVDLIMERFAELIGRIPWLVTLSIFMALIGPGFLSLILILVVSGWVGVAAVTRTQFYRYKGREYVLASRTLGAKDSRLIFRHILPNGIGTIITASILMIPAVIFIEASLSYLGFGIGHGQSLNLGLFELSGVSIGVLLADGQAAMLNRPYLTIFPAIVISILMITFNLFGNALRDAFNPSLRGSE